MKCNNSTDQLYDSIKQLIESSKSNIARNVNTIIILTHFEIGRMIIEDEQSGKSWADSKQLSLDLTRDFGKDFRNVTLNISENFISTTVIEFRKHCLRFLKPFMLPEITLEAIKFL